jgi:predicted nucleic acid-binding protein
LKFLFDTNVYFELLYDREYFERYAEILATVGPRLYLCSVVALELLQGARGELGRARVRRAFRALERVGRVVAPIHSDWVRAGHVQSRLWDEHPRLRQKMLANDILIACSAARVGAAVVSNNEQDFALIRRYVVHRALTLDALPKAFRS